MSEQQGSICFTCGFEVGEPPKLNRTEAGSICHTCRDRVLDSLAPVLPVQTVMESSADWPPVRYENRELGRQGDLYGAESGAVKGPRAMAADESAQAVDPVENQLPPEPA